MTQELAAELRIFTGLHTGAHAALAPGVYVLGSDPACDFILCDEGVAGRHAELHISDTAWILHPLTERGATAGELRLRAGEGVAIGSAMIAIDAPRAPWQMTDPVAPPEASPEPEANALPLESADPVMPVVVTDVASQRGPGRYLLPSLAVVVLLAGLLWALALQDANEPDIPPALPVAVSSDAQIRAIIDSMNLASRTQLERRSDGLWVVRAEQLSAEEYENLAATLSRVNPRPEFKVLDEQDLIREVRDVLKVHDASLTADHLGGGRFRINGRIAGETERDALLQTLAKEVPTARGFESALLTPDSVATKVLDALLDNGATTVTGEWQDETFIVSAKLSRLDLPRWESALLIVEGQYGKLLSYKIHTSFDDAVEAGLPFRILGIAGGMTPFVVLSDRSKVLLGGSAQGWRLTEVDGNQVVFEGPRRLAVKR